MNFATVSAKCSNCESPIEFVSESGVGDYSTDGKMDPVVALMAHGMTVQCLMCGEWMMFRTDFLGSLYVVNMRDTEC